MKGKNTANIARLIQRKHTDVSEKNVGEISKRKIQKHSALKFLSLAVYISSCYIYGMHIIIPIGIFHIMFYNILNSLLVREQRVGSKILVQFSLYLIFFKNECSLYILFYNCGPLCSMGF